MAATLASLEKLRAEYWQHYRNAMAIAQRCEEWDLDPKPMRARARNSKRRAKATEKRIALLKQAS